MLTYNVSGMQLSYLLEHFNPWWRDPTRRVFRGWMRRDLHGPLLAAVTDLGNRRAILLLGPKQVGKSVLLGQIADDLLDQGWPAGNLIRFDFRDERCASDSVPAAIAAVDPPGLDPRHPKVLLFDEITQVVEWGVRWDLWLKRTIDEDRAHGPPSVRVLVTDSSAHLLHTGAVESLQGRCDLVRIRGLAFREYLRLFGAPEQDPVETFRRFPAARDRYLLTGGFPEHVGTPDPEQAQARIRRDVLGLAVTRAAARERLETGGVERLFTHLVEQSGAIFDAPHRASDLKVDARTVESWLHLLEHTALIERLEPALGVRARAPKARSRLRARPKVYAADPALVTAFAPTAWPLASDEVLARAYECAVHRHLRDVADDGTNLGYWRQGEELEIDFLVEVKRKRIAVEVTKAPDPPPAKLERLLHAAKEAGARRTILVHGGLQRDTRLGIALVPFTDFLLDPAECVHGD